MLSRCTGAIRGKSIRNVAIVLKIEAKTTTSLQCRNLHIAQQRRAQILANRQLLGCHSVLSTTSFRSLSELTNNQSADPDLTDTLPKIPDAPLPIEDVGPTLAANGEPAFETLGLGGYSPVGLVQSAMEYLHVTLDLPWWGVIMCGTIAVRTLIFPLVILTQRNAAKMSNNMPQLQTLQLKMSDARQTGNHMESARLAHEMHQFMKDKDVSPFKSLLVPLAQAPVFISFFMGLRQMANAPVESLRTGGLFWFTDLTMPDQYYLLPIITSTTLYITILVGTDGAKLSQQTTQTLKYVLRVLPIVIFPFTINFPGAILCYWVCSNFISLIQVGVLRVPAVRDFFKIEKLITYSPDSLPMKKKGFVEGFKESMTNMKISRELAERERIDMVQFQRAGTGPIVKTFKFDPTKVQKMPTVLGSATVETKKR
ncbi:Mitochondrial inner membrane protein OXA1L [Pseudolycoriella hygida]|uniref:Mitochondrial inner membrane protein OXA1L n=1 Tax=Pseudolycoriella hygida TaxID=35572 RepID=A0A9Q0N123_9DIPT|nr:Mitochondrial inner membrane protein OXA1L [Pseudolycoriella hygida]